MPHEEKEDHVFISVGEKLNRLSPSSSECFIFKVHDQLRKVNEKAYEPNIIAIGPYHRGKSNLQIMEEHKLRYLQFRLRDRDDLQRYIDAMRGLEGEVRKCYIEPLTLTENELVEMILLDGFFIIEFMRKFRMVNLRDENDPIFEVKWIVNCLQRDLLLFENQLPLFVLCKLMDMIEAEGNHKIRLNHLAFHSFPDIFLRLKNSTPSVVDDKWQQATKNLLGLVHNNWFPSFAKSESVADTPNERKWWFIPCVTKLRKAGIKSVTEEGVADTPNKRKLWSIPCVTKLREAGIKFEKMEEVTTSFHIKFKKGKMQIPTLVIEGRTESFFRNLMAYEEYHQSTQNFRFVMDYVKFMDCLIDSPKDVDILCRHEILENWLGDDEAVSCMFNKLNACVTGPGKHFRYAKIFNDVNEYYGKTLPSWMAKLRGEYFSSPWSITSVIAASVLLVLTILQTVYTVMGYY